MDNNFFNSLLPIMMQNMMGYNQNNGINNELLKNILSNNNGLNADLLRNFMPQNNGGNMMMNLLFQMMSNNGNGTPKKTNQGFDCLEGIIPGEVKDVFNYFFKKI